MKNDDIDRQPPVMDGSSLWGSVDRSRWFLITIGLKMPAGSTPIRNLFGQTARVDKEWLTSFEVSDDQARRWARDDLGQTLDELKQGIDERLADLRRQLDEKNQTPVTETTTVTPNAAPTLFDLLKKLPGVIGNSLSGEEQRVESAKMAMADLQRELKEAGIDLDDRFANFPDRLAELRKNYEEQRATKKSNSDGTTSDRR